MASAGLLSLSNDLLEDVLLKLTCSERARCTLLCQRLAHLTSNSQRLWRELEVEDCVQDPRAGPLAHLVPFLASHPRGVQRLTLKWGWGDTGHTEAGEPTMAALAGATALASGTLRCLEVELIELQTSSTLRWLGVWQWAAALRQLRWLRLVWDGHELTRHLGTLTQLKGLDLSTNPHPFENGDGPTLDLEPGCIPPHLEHLWLRRARLERWPAELAAAAGSLRQLDMHFVIFEAGDPSETANLGQLTQLTRLALEAWPLGPGLMSQLAALPSLQALSLRWAEFAGPPAEHWPQQQLGSLHSLTELDLGDLSLRQLPPGLTLLPALRVLNLAANELPRQLAAATAVSG